jgi:hypothetical protein
MSTFELGSYVTHAKMPELGAGEILAAEKGTIRIRFESGDRSFLWDLVAAHLTMTAEAPPPRSAPAKRKRATKKAAVSKA